MGLLLLIILSILMAICLADCKHTNSSIVPISFSQCCLTKANTQLYLSFCSERSAFQSQNGYRESSKLPSMKRNSKADCLVSQTAWEFDDQSTIISKFISGSTISPSALTQLPSLPDYLLQCKIELNNTKTGLILPLYIPSLVLNLVLDGCTGSQMTKYLSKPEFTSVGIGYYQQWAVIALATDSPLGSFNSAVNLSDLGLGYFYFVSSLLVGLFLLSG